MSVKPREQIPHGFRLTDSNKKTWIIGSDSGRPAEYRAAEYNGKLPTDYPALIKIKPHGDTHFIAEINFYKQHATDIDTWTASQNIKYLGLPCYLGSAKNVTIFNVTFDFLVLEGYDLDLQTLLVKENNLFPKPTVLKIAYQIVQVLQYLHQRGLVLGDISTSNLRCGWHNERRVFLLPQFQPMDESNPNAMIYWSRDRHCGEKTKRGDLESLLYNLIDWSGGILPWKNTPSDEVKDTKHLAFDNPQQFLEHVFHICKCEDPSGCMAACKCVVTGEPVAPCKCLQGIRELMEQVASMDKTSDCYYKVIEEILKNRLLNMYHLPTSKLNFSIPTNIHDQDHEDNPANDRTKNILGLAADVLAIIIAENCSSFDEVDKFDSEPDGVIGVVLQMKKTSRACTVKAAIQKAWKKDTHELRTKVIELWQLKGIETSDDTDRRETLGREEATTNGKKIQKRVTKVAKKKAAVVRRNKLPSEVEHTDEPVVLQDTDDEPMQEEPRPGPSSDNIEKIVRQVVQEAFAQYKQPAKSEDVQSSVPTEVPEQMLTASEKPVDESATSEALSTSTDVEQWHGTYDDVNIWLEMRRENMGVSGSTSSDPKMKTRIRVHYNEFSKPDIVCQLSQLAKVLAQLSPDSIDDAKKLDGIQQDWLQQLAWLEWNVQKLGDESISPLRDILKDPEILVWLAKELENMSGQLLVPIDHTALQQQREHWQRVIGRVTEVMKMLDDGREVLTRSQNHKNHAFQQLFLEVVQFQWNRLKHNVEISSKLDVDDKYEKARYSLLDWLAQAKLKNFMPASLKDTEKTLEELCSLDREGGEMFDQYTYFGRLFLDVCGEDRSDAVKKELDDMQYSWNELTADLRPREKLLSGLKKNLFNLRESESALCDALRKALTWVDNFMEAQDKRVHLQVALGAVRLQVDELVSQYGDRGIDASHLSKEMDLEVARIKQIELQLHNYCIQAFQARDLSKLVSCERSLSPAWSVVKSEPKESYHDINPLSPPESVVSKDFDYNVDPPSSKKSKH